MMFMHGSTTLTLIFVLVALLAHVEHNHKVEAVCCSWRPFRCWFEGRQCFGSKDGGGCNIFCCNCGKGCCACADSNKGKCADMCWNEPCYPNMQYLLSGGVRHSSQSRLGGPEENFAFFDKNHDGVIDSDETRLFLEAQGTYFNQSLFAGMDLNGNGVIEPGEFDEELK